MLKLPRILCYFVCVLKHFFFFVLYKIFLGKLSIFVRLTPIKLHDQIDSWHFEFGHSIDMFVHGLFIVEVLAAVKLNMMSKKKLVL